MAIINVIIHQHEKDALLAVIKKYKGQTISVTKLTREAGLNPNRGRFVMDELLQEGTVVKTATKSYNPKYVRYTYEVVK